MEEESSIATPSESGESDVLGRRGEPEGGVTSYENRHWLSAHYDPVAGIRTFPSCLALSDLAGDGEQRLVVADIADGPLRMRLKVFRGTTVAAENTLIDLPTAVRPFLMDQTEPRIPAVAVASGPYIYIYKNMRPYFKFTLPSLDVNAMELEVWGQAKVGEASGEAVREVLEELRREVGEAGLTTRSQHLLMLDSVEEIDVFIETHKHSALKRQTVITCMETMSKSTNEEDSVSCLVIGTEDCRVYVLDPEAFTILSTVILPAVPVLFSINGMFDVEFRIVVACRDACLYTIRRGAREPSSKSVISLSSQAIGLQRINKSLLVACMDQTLSCYSVKGKHMWTIRMPALITTLELMDYPSKGLKAVLVGLTNCQVHLYRDKFLLDIINTEDAVSSMKFGKFGREDGVLVMIGKSGALMIKILKRMAEFHEQVAQVGPPPSQNVKLNIPKKTKLFVDQTMRERENCVAMHRTFQHDLYLLRLSTARSFLHALNSNLNPVSFGHGTKLFVNAIVLGLGPTFKLILTVKNLDMMAACIDLFIVFHYDPSLYKLHRPHMPLPLLVPGVEYRLDTNVDCSNQEGLTGDIKCLVMKKGLVVPIVTAIVNMPISESILA